MYVCMYVCIYAKEMQEEVFHLEYQVASCLIIMSPTQEYSSGLHFAANSIGTLEEQDWRRDHVKSTLNFWQMAHCIFHFKGPIMSA